jgi:hypothetical protein
VFFNDGNGIDATTQPATAPAAGSPARESCAALPLSSALVFLHIFVTLGSHFFFTLHCLLEYATKY